MTIKILWETHINKERGIIMKKNNMNLNNEVIEIISEVTEIPKENIKLESNLLTDLELESLDIVNLIAEFEKKYKISIKDEEIKCFQTVEDIINYIEKNV